MPARLLSPLVGATPGEKSERTNSQQDGGRKSVPAEGFLGLLGILLASLSEAKDQPAATVGANQEAPELEEATREGGRHEKATCEAPAAPRTPVAKAGRAPHAKTTAIALLANGALLAEPMAGVAQPRPAKNPEAAQSPAPRTDRMPVTQTLESNTIRGEPGELSPAPSVLEITPVLNGVNAPVPEKQPQSGSLPETHSGLASPTSRPPAEPSVPTRATEAVPPTSAPPALFPARHIGFSLRLVSADEESMPAGPVPGRPQGDSPRFPDIEVPPLMHLVENLNAPATGRGLVTPPRHQGDSLVPSARLEAVPARPRPGEQPAAPASRAPDPSERRSPQAEERSPQSPERPPEESGLARGLPAVSRAEVLSLSSGLPAGPSLSHPVEPRPVLQDGPARSPENVPAERVPAEPTPGPRPASDLVFRVSGGQRGVQIQIQSRSGEVQVAVKASDPQLASSLRQDVGRLVSRLEDAGYHATSTVSPGHSQGTEARRPSENGNEPQHESGGGQRGSPGRNSHDQQRGQNQRRPPQQPTEEEKEFTL